MATPLGAVAAAPEVLNHFYQALATIIAGMFDTDGDTTTQSWIDEWFQMVDIPGAFLVAHAWLATPVPGPEIRGEEVTDDGFDELTFTLFPYAYNTPRFTLHLDDLEDSQAPKSMKERAEEGVAELRRYRERVFPELLEGTTGDFLHPEVSHTAYLGTASLYSTTHTVGAQTLSNQITLSGTGVGNIINDLWQHRAAYRAMLNSNGIHYWSGRNGKPKLLCVIPSQIEQAFAAAKLSETLVPAGATAPSSNYTPKDFEFDYEVLETLTSATNWYTLRRGDSRGIRPLVEGRKKQISRKDWREGSDFTNARNMIGFQWRVRAAFGAGSSFHTTKAAA